MVKKITVSEQSPKGQLNMQDAKKIAKGAAIAFGAAALYSISQALMSGIVDWKVYVPAAIAVGINAVLKLYQGK